MLHINGCQVTVLRALTRDRLLNRLGCTTKLEWLPDMIKGCHNNLEGCSVWLTSLTQPSNLPQPSPFVALVLRAQPMPIWCRVVIRSVSQHFQRCLFHRHKPWLRLAVGWVNAQVPFGQSAEAAR